MRISNPYSPPAPTCTFRMRTTETVVDWRDTTVQRISGFCRYAFLSCFAWQFVSLSVCSLSAQFVSLHDGSLLRNAYRNKLPCTCDFESAGLPAVRGLIVPATHIVDVRGLGHGTRRICRNLVCASSGPPALAGALVRSCNLEAARLHQCESGFEHARNVRRTQGKCVHLHHGNGACERL